MDKVYGAVLSPFVRKVIFALEMKQVAYTTKMVIPFQLPAGYLEKSPLVSPEYYWHHQLLKYYQKYAMNYLVVPSQCLISHYYYPRKVRC